jgi:hypothetical protein
MVDLDRERTATAAQRFRGEYQRPVAALSPVVVAGVRRLGQRLAELREGEDRNGTAAFRHAAKRTDARGNPTRRRTIAASG